MERRMSHSAHGLENRRRLVSMNALHGAVGTPRPTLLRVVGRGVPPPPPHAPAFYVGLNAFIHFGNFGLLIHNAPKRRWRRLYSSRAAKNCGLRKSGQRVCVTTSSV